MQDKYSIDDQFRERLYGSESAPPPMVWTNVAAELARQKRRKLLGFWLGGGVAVAGIFAASYFLYENVASKNAGKLAQALTQQDTPLADHNSTGGTIFGEEKTSGLGGISSKNSAAAVVNERAIAKNPQETVAGFQKKDNIKTTGSKQDFVEKGMAVFEQFGPKKSTESGQVFEKNAPLTIDNQPVANVGELESAEAGATVFQANKVVGEGLKSTALDNFDQLSGHYFSLLKKEKPAQLPKTRAFKLKKKKPLCPSFADRGEVFFLDFYAGPGMAFHTFSARDSDTPGYVKLREQTESSKFAWTAGARGGWLFAGQFLLRAGLNFTEVDEHLKYYNPKYRKTVVTILPSGQRDTAYYYGEHFVDRSNHLQFVDLPVTVGVEKCHGPIGWSINGGVSANLLFLKNAKFIDPATDKAVSSKSTLRANAGLSLLADAQVFYQIDRKSRVFIEPSYQHILRPVSKKSMPVTEKYRLGSINFGFTRLLK